VTNALLAAIAAGEKLPATGTAHGHVRLADGRLARIACAHPGDPDAARRLALQAAAFRHLAPAGHTPRLHDVVPPCESLPGGALIVDFIAGRLPRLPQEMPAVATTLARLHALPLPDPALGLPRQENPFLATLEVVEVAAARYLDRAVPEARARAEIAEELRAVRAMGLALGRRPQPLSVALADTHPGNFIIDASGVARFVDLEKVHVGSAAIDLAHASLPTSTLWHPDIGVALSPEERAAFEETYFAEAGPKRAAALRPWIVPMRRLTWLRTTLFMARWRVETTAPRDPANPAQWSDSGLEPRMREHLRRRIAMAFEPDAIRAVRVEWGA